MTKTELCKSSWLRHYSINRCAFFDYTRVSGHFADWTVKPICFIIPDK